MERVIILQKILNYLTRLSDLLSISNRAGETNISKISESLVRELLNTIYDYDLKNCNLNISNYPAIDLNDENRRISVQVTSTKDVKKIVDTYDTFFSKKLHQKYDNLIFIILGVKKYDLKKLDISYKKIAKKYNLDFRVDFESNLIDINSLYNLISNNCNIDKIGDSDEPDHLIPGQADHQFRGKLTRGFRDKLTTLNV